MKHTLLLQGPVGPFFDRWAEFLKKNSQRKIWKIHFNWGDSCFYHQGNEYHYRGAFDAWPDFFQKFVVEHKISEVFLCGDCRPYHQSIISLCKELSLDIWVFEEGYLRPHCVVLEKNGVNAFSDDYKKSLDTLRPHFPLSRTLPYRSQRTPLSFILLSIRYYGSIVLEKFATRISNSSIIHKIGALFSRQSPLKEKAYRARKFYNYCHYRPMSPREIFYFMRSFARKIAYVAKEHKIREKLRSLSQQSLFIVPLQIAHDSQITEHSDFPDIETFITEVLQSFAQAAPAETSIVFKHHPLDRGHCHYGKHIDHTVRRLQIDPQRVLYVHTTSLAFFWPRALGCITINSTSGFNALQNGIPTICLGRCLYHREGITHMGSLDDFWTHPQKPQRTSVQQLADYWKSHVLIQASFYHPLQHDLWDCIPPHLRKELGLRKG
jgi:capsular polysaccharide export protein